MSSQLSIVSNVNEEDEPVSPEPRGLSQEKVDDQETGEVISAINQSEEEASMNEAGEAEQEDQDDGIPDVIDNQDDHDPQLEPIVEDYDEDSQGPEQQLTFDDVSVNY